MAVTAELVEQVKILASKGLSSSMIGVEVGKTRNSIIGICHRNGIQLKRLRGYGGGIKRLRHPKIMAYAPPAMVEQVKTERAKRERAVLVVPAKEPPKPVPSCSVSHLNNDICHWPMWDENVRTVEQMFFCGAVTNVAPYCKDHYWKSVRG